MFWFLYDPFTAIALFTAYIVGFIVLIIAAGVLAPRVARGFTGRFTLQASMLIIGLIVVLSGLAGVGLTAYIIGGVLGESITTGFIAGIILFILVLNIISYLVSPITINIMYGAKPSPELQDVVNSVARRLGFANPPKAVVVNGPPNAFAYGNILFGKYVAVSNTLLEMVDREELEAIIGHELGHHRHRDNAIMLFMGMIPSILYFLGVTLIRIGFISSYARSAYSGRRREGGGGLLLALAGVAAVVVSFIVQVLVLAFSRLREYYADTSGARAAGIRPMQRALARLHVYYTHAVSAKEAVSSSKIKALFIYALTEAYANPFYRRYPTGREVRDVDIDRVVEELKKKEVSDVSEFFSTHPAIPKRIRFLESLAFKPITDL
jgi:heat shock protein HtpX